MNQSSSLLERLSPRPIVCPLVRLGCSSPISEQQSNASERLYHSESTYGYHTKYMDLYETSANSTSNYGEKLRDSTYHYCQSQFLNNNGSDYRSNPAQSPLVHNTINTYQKQNSLDLSSLSLGTSYWEHENYNKLETSQSDSSPEYFTPKSQVHQDNETNYLLDNFTKLGKSSPSLDQGYHTLVSPSPGSTTPNLWNEGNLYKGKKYQIKNNSFDRLNDELVVKIFSFLTSLDLSVCAKVCRRFDVLVWTPALWRTIQLDGEYISGDRAIRGVLRQLCGQGRTGACPSVERVYLSDGAKITDRGLLLLARRCPELTHLKIQGSTAVSNNAFFEVLNKCANLQHLDVTGEY